MTYELGDLQPPAFDQPTPPRRSNAAVVTVVVAVIAVVAAAVTAAALLRGGDSANKHEDVLSVVRAAGTAAAAQKSLRAEFEMRVSASGFDLKTGGEMVADNANKVGSGTLDMPGLGKVEFRSVGGLSYTHLPNGRVDGAGHHWLSAPNPDFQAALGTQDPLAFLKLMSSSESVEELGNDKVNDVDATHYRAHLDPQKLLDLGGKAGLNVPIPPNALDQLKDLTSDVWIDDDNLPRRMTMAVAIDTAKMTMTMNFYDYGKPVEVTPPPSTDVTAFSSPVELGQQLARIGRGGASG